MAKEISEIEMLLKKGDVVIDFEPLTAISSKKMRHDSAGPSERSNIDVPNEDPLKILVQNEFDALLGEAHVSRPVTIFHVPIYRERMKRMLEPKMVAIGPYHHGKQALRPLEKHKWRYLRDFLARKPEIGIEIYLAEMRALEKHARQCYDDVIEMSPDEFALMLLLDGCFILEYHLKLEDVEPDSITGVGWDTVIPDFMMMENQIPYSVIHKLGMIYYGILDHNSKDECPVRTLVYNRMQFQYMFSNSPELSCGQINHLLHLYQLFMTPPIDAGRPDQTSDSDQTSNSDNIRCLSWLRSRLGLQHKKVEFLKIPSATKLHEAGVTFKEKNDPRHMFDITFENGVMEIPFVKINEDTKTLFTNVLLCEQAQEDKIPRTLTSYLILMDFLMDTADDVALVEQCGSIGNFLATGEEVALFFNELCDYTIINLTESYYINLTEKVLKYINSPWHSYRAMLVHDYFSNPWAILSFIAAILLLLLTVTQTGFSVYPVVHPN